MKSLGYKKLKPGILIVDTGKKYLSLIRRINFGIFSRIGSSCHMYLQTDYFSILGANYQGEKESKNKYLTCRERLYVAFMILSYIFQFKVLLNLIIKWVVVGC